MTAGHQRRINRRLRLRGLRVIRKHRVFVHRLRLHVIRKHSVAGRAVAGCIVPRLRVVVVLRLRAIRRRRVVLHGRAAAGRSVTGRAAAGRVVPRLRVSSKQRHIVARVNQKKQTGPCPRATAAILCASLIDDATDAADAMDAGLVDLLHAVRCHVVHRDNGHDDLVAERRSDRPHYLVGEPTWDQDAVDSASIADSDGGGGVFGVEQASASPAPGVVLCGGGGFCDVDAPFDVGPCCSL